MVDLLYSNEFEKVQNVNADKTSYQTTLNMKHALAQIGVAVKVVNPKIQVEVSEVALVNLNGQADFQFATGKDLNDEQWANASGKYTAIASIETPKRVKFITEKAAEGETPAVVNNGVDLLVDEDNTNTFMVLPNERYEAIKDNTQITIKSGVITDTNAPDGTCIALKCKIWNIASADEKADATNDLLIHGTADEYKYLYVPVALKTKMGTRYTYTISFGKGHAGFTENGANTLVAIDWAVSEPKSWTDVTPAENAQ